MGAASCKNSKLPLESQQKTNNKNITIGVFGLDDAGKTSTIKAIEGEPTDHVLSTISSSSTLVANPLINQNNKNKDQQRIKIIDVNGERKFRQKSWSQYYDQIHGLIYVIDASDKRRLNENQETLEDLLENDKLKNKPILILANKQDQKGAINNENNLRHQLAIEKLKTKHKIEFCTALPQKQKTKVDESIRKGFLWLIRTIDENYTELNAHINKKTNRFENNGYDSDNTYWKGKPIDSRLKITSEKLPSINTNKNKTKTYSDDDDDDNERNYLSSNKKKPILGLTNSKEKPIKKSNDNEPKAFRSTYESFPEETPWISSSILRTTKSDDTLPRLYNTKSSLTNDTKRRDMSPLVHDTKSYTHGSLTTLTKRDNEDDFYRQQKSKSTNRLDNSTLSTNKFSSNIKKSTSGIYDDDDDYGYNNNRRNITTTKTSYNYDDDDDDQNKNYPRSSSRSNLHSEYRGTLSKTENHSKYNSDNDDDYLTSKPITRSTYNKDYSTSKSTNRSRYNNDDDDDDNDNDNYRSSSKSKSHSKFEDDDYPISKRSNYNNHDDDDDDDDYYPSSSKKVVTRSNYNNDDDDDYYSNSTKKNNYSSSYGTNSSRFRSENDDFFTTKAGTNNTNRFKKTTGYDS